MSGIGYFSCSGNANDDFFSLLRLALLSDPWTHQGSFREPLVCFYPLSASPSSPHQQSHRPLGGIARRWARVYRRMVRVPGRGGGGRGVGL